MSDPAQESTKSSRSQPQEASLEDLVAALGRPRPDDGDFPEDELEDGQESSEASGEGQGEDPAQAKEDAKQDEPDPFAEYSDLDLATSLPIDPDDDLSKVKGDASPRLMSIIESLLFASDKPMTVKSIRRLLKEPTKRQIQLALKQLIVDTQHRGVVLGQVAGGFRLRTHPDNAPFVQKMLAGKPVRLSRSQLESLAVVAYRQPVTKAELDHIRGVDCGAVLRVLLERDLVKIVGRKEEPGRPHLYGTTVAFLEFFNLKGLRDLPDLQEFKELSEESEATLRHTMHATSLADEQEAMGQARIEFPDKPEGEGTAPGSEEGAPAPSEAGDSEGQGDDVAGEGASEDDAASEGNASSEGVSADAPSDAAASQGEGSESLQDGEPDVSEAEGPAAAQDADADPVEPIAPAAEAPAEADASEQDEVPADGEARDEPVPDVAPDAAEAEPEPQEHAGSSEVDPPTSGYDEPPAAESPAQGDPADGDAAPEDDAPADAAPEPAPDTSGNAPDEDA